MIYASDYTLNIQSDIDPNDDVTCAVAWVDDDGTSLTPGTNTILISSTSPEDLITSGSPGSVRYVRYLGISNTDGSATYTISIWVDTGAAAISSFSWPLGPGEMLTFVANQGWEVFTATGPKKVYPVPGSSGSLIYNSGGSSLGGATNALIEDNELALPMIATPTVPTAGRIKVFARDVASRGLAAVIGPSGRNTSLQPFLGRNRVCQWNPVGNATTTPIADGIASPTATGTATSRTVATTNLATSMKRLGYVSAAGAGSLAGARLNQAQFCLGDGTIGGVMLVARFTPSDATTVSGARMFVGLSSATGAPTNVEPDTLTNCIGVCQLSTSANLHLIHNDGSGTATTVDLGASFPADGNSVPYELALFSNSGSGEVGYRVERLDTGGVDEGVLSTNIPIGTTLLTIQIWRTNNATASAVGIDVCSVYLESDY